MGNPLGPTFANIFLCYHEQLWLNSCPPEFKPLLYKRYIDDCLVIFKHQSHAPLFLQYLNTRHPNIQFTSEIENNGSLPFLDILISHDSSSFSTSVYRKPSNTLLGTNFFSNIHTKFILTPLHTLFNRAYNISSNWFTFHNEISFLKIFFFSNLYPTFLFENELKNFLNKIIDPPPIISTVPLLPLYIKIPYLGKLSPKLHKELYLVFKKFLPYSKPNFIPTNNSSIRSFFQFKDTLP